jgi:hypothetical protein
MPDKQERRAEALDLQRAVELGLDAVDEPPESDGCKRNDHEGDHRPKDAESGEGRSRAFAAPHEREGRGKQYDRIDLRRDGEGEDAEPDPVAPRE